MVVITAIVISVWQAKVYFSHAEDLSSTVTVTGGSGGGGDPLIPPDPITPPAGSVFISTITAHPERRSGSVGANYYSTFYFSILNSSSREIIYQHPSLLESSASGVYSTPIELPPSVVPGTYDIAIKTTSHLTKILDDVSLAAGDNHLNFTNETNSPTNGSLYLTAGDIEGLGTVPGSLGDNVINAVDLSILLHQLGISDIAGGNRANLNRDLTVDQADLNILLDNLDKNGD